MFILFQRKNNSLTYPINVGRNIAREAANSHYILPSDIEMYPSPGLIPSFLKMITNGNQLALTSSNHSSLGVFVIPVFEIEENISLPNTKRELIPLLQSQKVIPFHKRVCNNCLALPNSKQWMSDLSTGTRVQVYYL